MSGPLPVRLSGSMQPGGYTAGHFINSEPSVAKPNYAFEKRQRELAAKKKKDEKLARKQAAKENPAPAHDEEPSAS